MLKNSNHSSVNHHPYTKAPNRTFFFLGVPLLFSLIAEPLTGLVDTAFISRLGSVPLAALGVGTITLSSLFWAFNFLSIGTQTEIAHAWGKQNRPRVAEIGGMAFCVGVVLGALVMIVGYFFVDPAIELMGASGKVHEMAGAYVRIRLFGAPAVLATIVSFGIMRGAQEMKTPLIISLVINLFNILLDIPLIFGFWMIPALGIPGAAIASVVSQWIGGVICFLYIRKHIGFPERFKIADVLKIFTVGRDIFIRTGLLTFFLLLTTRAATLISPEAGAAHQGVRQAWVFTALLLDAYALTGQSLIGFFLGAKSVALARKVAFTVVVWTLGTGILLTIVMAFTSAGIASLLAPIETHSLFYDAWMISAFMQPINALSFAADGIHWGSGDYRFLRNVMIAATGIGWIGLSLVDLNTPDALAWIWYVIALWVCVRAFFGMIRIWPGFGKSPLDLKL